MFELKNVVNTVEMAVSNSRLLQIAWKMDTAGNPKKIPRQFRFFSRRPGCMAMCGSQRWRGMCVFLVLVQHSVVDQPWNHGRITTVEHFDEFWWVLLPWPVGPRVGQVNLVLASCKENVLIRRDVAIRSLGVESAINCGLAREVIWELCGIALLEAWWQIWLAETSWSSPCQTWSRQAPFHEETWRTRAARNQSFESWWDERNSELQRGIYLRCSQNKILGRPRKHIAVCASRI